MTLQHTRRIVKSLLFCLSLWSVFYLLPRVASVPLLRTANKVYGPSLPKLNPLPLPPKDGTYLHGWFIPYFRQAGKRRRDVIHVHGNAGNMSAHWR